MASQARNEKRRVAPRSWGAETVVQRISQVVRTFAWWAEVARQRQQLREMDERMLKDLGISRAEAVVEGSRPFWDVPPRRGREQTAVATSGQAPPWRSPACAAGVCE